MVHGNATGYSLSFMPMPSLRPPSIFERLSHNRVLKQQSPAFGKIVTKLSSTT